MKATLLDDTPSVEKRTWGNLMVCLIDKAANVIWSAHDPLNYVPTKILDTVFEADQEIVLNALSHCILKGETVDYIARGLGLDGDMETWWTVRLFPLQRAAGGQVACVCLSRTLPKNHCEIKEDEEEMVRLLADDNTLREISEKMFLSESSIDTKMRQLKAKLGVRNIGGLVALASTSGLI